VRLRLNGFFDAGIHEKNRLLGFHCFIQIVCFAYKSSEFFDGHGVLTSPAKRRPK